MLSNFTIGGGGIVRGDSPRGLPGPPRRTVLPRLTAIMRIADVQQSVAKVPRSTETGEALG